MLGIKQILSRDISAAVSTDVTEAFLMYSVRQEVILFLKASFSFLM
jgi:hypothetical protein